MIKVLNITTSALTYNGISMSIMNYFRNIDNTKVQMDFVTPNVVDKSIKEEIQSKNCKIYELAYKNSKMRQKRPLMYYRKLYKILKKENYNIVHVHGSSAMMFIEMMAAKRAGCKVRIAHSRNTKSDHKILHYLCKPLFKNSYTDAFSCGIEAGEWLFGKKAKFTIIPNGKDCDMFKYNKDLRKEYRKKYNLIDKKVIGHVGNFSFQKNHDFLIDIFNELSKKDDKYYMVLAGEGNLQDSIVDKVKKLGIENKVLFLGKVTNINEWLNAMDIMVFPSRFEGFPNVLIEWQISGLPCIISDKITKDVKITDLVRFKSIEDSAENWSNEILKIKIQDRDNPKYIEEVKKAGYDIKENAKMLEKIYDSLVEEKK